MPKKMITGERIYTIPLRKWIVRTRRIARSKRVIKAIKNYLLKHTKAEDIRISQQLNSIVWVKGAKKPPHRIKIKVRLEDKIAKAMLPEEIDVLEKKKKQKPEEVVKVKSKTEVKKT